MSRAAPSDQAESLVLPDNGGLCRAVLPCLPAVIAGGLVVLTYVPVVQFDYGKLDDYWFLWASNTDAELITRHDWERGRFLAALLHGWAFGAITTISEIRWVRGLTVLALAGLAAALAVVLESRGWPRWLAAALAVLVCTTPSAQSTAGFAASVHRPCAALCALLAGAAVAQGAYKRATYHAAGWLLAALAALLAALFFQQSWAMFYVTCCYVAFFRADHETPQPRRLRLLAMQGATLVGALATAAIATRLLAEPTVRTTLTREPYSKLVWFLKEPLVNAAALLQITPSHATVALVAALVVAGAGAFLVRRRTFDALCLLWGVVLLPVAYLPNLLTAESWASYRSIGPLSASIVILVAWAVFGIGRLAFRDARMPVTVLFVALALFSCLMARSNVLNHVVRQQVAERALFRAQLFQAAQSSPAAVHLIRPSDGHWPERTYRYEDFGVLSTCADWCPEPMFRLLAAELPDPLAERLAGLPVTWSTEPKDAEGGRLLQIDMRLLREFEAGQL